MTNGKELKHGDAKIVIGARSAIFAPLKNVGVIIIDEEHDSSYKSELSPKYDVREVACKICDFNNIPLVFGSATPDVKTYYKALNNDIILLELKNRISAQGMPNVSIIDMRNELNTGNKTPFSRKLYYAIKENVEKNEQTMLFINRRGYSTFLMCRDCGYVVKCDKCDVSMTYHYNENNLICHYCGRTKAVLSNCPSCGSSKIKFFGTGTQKIEQELKKYLPNVSIIRMDIDTTRGKNAHEEILNKFKNDNINVLLGTQMITKGHDFKNVTLVGVLAADGLINMGDYKANERAFQLLTQVAGRAGRGDKKGNVLIQTYSPNEFSIVSAKEQDYKSFYNKEIIMREKLNYPPFCDIIVAVAYGDDENLVKRTANDFYNKINNTFNAFNATPAPIAKINNEYRYRVLIKDNLTDEKRAVLKEIVLEFQNSKKYSKLSVDINPNNMY